MSAHENFDELLTLVEKLATKNHEFADRLTDLDQRRNALDGGHFETKGINLGDVVIASDAYKALLDGSREKARIVIKTAIINSVGQNQPLVPADRLAGIVSPATRGLRIRDLLAVGRTTSNLVEFAKEDVFTNNAGPQVSGSPEAFENVTKPESAITFTLATAAVTTLSHWIPVSKQVLSDSPALSAYLNARLMYGLKLKEDTQLLLGTGSNGQLPGLYTNRTAYSMTSPLTYSTKLDVLRDAISQIQASDFEPNGIVLHPTDWRKIELAKDSQNRYIFSNPQSASAPSLWGLPVVVTNSLTAGTFLVGDFAMAAQIWDREDATIEIGLNSDNFTKNMVTVLCEERIALSIYRTAALVGGSFPA